MKKSYILLTLVLTLACTIITGCNGSKENNVADTTFPIYTEDINTGKRIISSYIEIPDDIEVAEKIQMLCETMSEEIFDDNMEFIGIATSRGEKIAIINLMTTNDNRSAWYFTGSTGGGMTYTTITETILQTDYKGEWIDGVFFLRDSKILLDDITALESIIYR